MALATHQYQGSLRKLPSGPLQCSSGSKSKSLLRITPALGHKDRFTSLKCQYCLSSASTYVLGPKRKSLKISSFKGSQSDESGFKSTRSKSQRKSVELSHVPKTSPEKLIESPNIQNAYPSKADESVAGSLAIQNLFKNWLTLMRAPSPNQAVDQTLEEPFLAETLEAQSSAQKEGKGGILKEVWSYFLGLDATVKIPLIIFIPCYLAVNLRYGSEVSRELTPLWLLGPVIVALYIKMLRGICSLYAFTFKQTIRVVKNLPTYYLVAYRFLAQGKHKEVIRTRLLQPALDIKNMDYKDVLKRKMKDLQVFLVEKYLDFVESIWPYYCRTIRFLKRANLI